MLCRNSPLAQHKDHIMRDTKTRTELLWKIIPTTLLAASLYFNFQLLFRLRDSSVHSASLSTLYANVLLDMADHTGIDDCTLGQQARNTLQQASDEYTTDVTTFTNRVLSSIECDTITGNTDTK